MFEFFIGAIIGQVAIYTEINIGEFIIMFALLMVCLGVLAINAYISPDGDVKNTISVIKKYIAKRFYT